MWTEARVEFLKELWAEGLSAAHIANKMGGVTRNAVIGKVHRLGLAGRATPAKPQRGCAPETTSPTLASIVGSAALNESAADVSTAQHIHSAGNKTKSTRRSFSPHKKCKWPSGDPLDEDFSFCEDSTTNGTSYCLMHARLAFQPNNRSSGYRRRAESYDTFA